MSDETAPKSDSNASKSSGKRSLRIITGDGTGNPPPRRFSLATVRGCRSELASLYRLARGGQMDLSGACKFAYLITSIAKLIEIGDLEQRLNVLEEVEAIDEQYRKQD